MRILSVPILLEPSLVSIGQVNFFAAKCELAQSVNFSLDRFSGLRLSVATSLKSLIYGLEGWGNYGLVF